MRLLYIFYITLHEKLTHTTMHKKVILLIIALAASATVAMAQDVWQAPKKVQQVEEKAQKEKKEKSKKETEQVVKNGKVKKMKIDQKYAAGAVPEVEGKVEWSWTFEMPGRTADEAYNEMMDVIEKLTNMPEQTDRSQIAVVNPKEHIIAANMVEQLEFSKTALSHDFTTFRYSLICQTFDGKATLRMCHLVYDYEKDRPTGATYVAEEWITDSKCLNKSKTNVYPSNGKFRKKTIDRKDNLYIYFDQAIKLNKK